ncbi:DExH-box splicing factor binding site-domain-containing protein [Suillus placidus]|uniref:DExH-box splicing factor binding site-domain-containing protein n=1 Tax=Suillus placidus TaxID=48579 RepID=A0A9P6ZUG4_9AGAM|nr:DExH-box splicing factor binding site-domain-containing protein [Suillus placidus]
MTIEEHINAIIEETEDQKALRALLAGDVDLAPQIDSIPVPPSETDALQQDVADLPDVATIDDYARVPITAFGAAMLRGMGWVDGGAVTSSERAKKNALVEPYLPKSRPALLGIGAKEQEVLDDGSKKKKRRGDEKRYVPLVRQESSREESRNESAIVSRRASWSPERRSGGESRGMMTATSLGEKVIAIGDENATVTIEETETEMTGGEEMIVEGTATGTWTDETEIAMSINVVTESVTTTTETDEETGSANGEDGTDEINMGTITPFIATSVLRLLDLYSFNSS